ncbi:MAG TPA: hypothetical protein VJ142_00135 [Candidatus Nanoarchaeia archaeon]|nr:hypothetical protein [Candidatus Nanoarchaeia archaeon]
MTLTNLRTYRIIGADMESIKKALAQYAKSNGNYDFSRYDVNGFEVILMEKQRRISISSSSSEHGRARSQIEEILKFPLADIPISPAELNQRNKRSNNNRKH